MRIVGGQLRGRLIEPPSNLKARPTTDYARESLFNILNNRYDFEKISVLDLFSGTGAISYEFASRGVNDIDLVEIDGKHTEFIGRTLRNFSLKSVRVHRMCVRKWIGICRKRYDIVFADPPYALPWLQDLPEMVLNSKAVDADSVFILEHPRTLDFSTYPSFYEHRNYGNVNFSFFRKQKV